ncbi:MAG: hypothetical protein ACOCY3_02420 [Desulfosalsimonas sp.]
MKTITMMLGSPPYSGQDADTVLGIADAAAKKGHNVTVIGRVSELFASNSLQLIF